ncbi:MAG: 5-oxoprolinase/urea amidolyase family protein, partial [bacterium]
MTVHRLGDRALLLECAPDLVAGYLAAARDAAESGEWEDVVDIVAAARTLLVRFASDAERRVAALSALVPGDATTQPDTGRSETSGSAAPLAARHVDIDVVYDGADLDAVAAETGLSPARIVALHSGVTYRASFCGFAPGFAYLTGLDPRLSVARRASPRPRVPSGSVALAADYTAVYPRASPGGWRLIGRTDADLFDPWRSPPALITPGSTVRFHPVDALAGAPEPRPPAEYAAAGDAGAEVVRAQGLALLQDSGRPGLGLIAVGASGAFDRASHRLANRLLGNDESAAVIELVGGGLSLRALRACAVVVTGAEGPVSVNGAAAARHAPIHLRTGDLIDVGMPASGLRSYIGLRGGIAVRPLLGSASTDTLAGLGPARLVTGDVVFAGTPGAVPGVDLAPRGTHPAELLLRVIAGPRWDWFAPQAHRTLTEASYAVSQHSDRIGVRLDGPPLPRETRRESAELPPEGMVRGALQVPPDGRPVLLGPDHPVTGGYPVIAAVIDADLDAVAQA